MQDRKKDTDVYNGLLDSVSYYSAFSYCSWGSQGKNTEVFCYSLLQWTTFCHINKKKKKGWSQSKNNSQLWMGLVIEARLSAVKIIIAQEAGM